jgi:hypothetical protein
MTEIKYKGYTIIRESVYEVIYGHVYHHSYRVFGRGEIFYRLKDVKAKIDSLYQLKIRENKEYNFHEHDIVIEEMTREEMKEIFG